MTHSARALAAILVDNVVAKGRSLSQLFDEYADELAAMPNKERSLTKALTHGALRHYPRWRVIIDEACGKRLKRSETLVRALLAVGLYQLLESRVPPHAAISETVNAARQLDKPWACSLLNAVLRRVQREPHTIQAWLRKTPWAMLDLPQWLWTLWKRSWPKHIQLLASGSNSQAPMTVRVNRQKTTREHYCRVLADAGIAAQPHPVAPDALVLRDPVEVNRLPGFYEGLASVQDAAAQLAGLAVAPQPEMRILDACAAPGGKTAHILEICPEAVVNAVDSDPIRLKKVEENLRRIGAKATLIRGDACHPDSWWDGQPFDVVLLDAPCSATGVIRRHPDIKLLRRLSDVTAVATTQKSMLQSLWPLVRPGGRLIYATCAVTTQENEVQIQKFIDLTPDARAVPLPWTDPSPLPTAIGWQCYPGWQFMDGFYYAALHKQTMPDTP